MGTLIADSGSTKTDWILINDPAGKQRIQSSGINPFFRTTESIFDELQAKFQPILNRPVDEIFFYGAGIVNQDKANVVRDALFQLFPGTAIEIHSDSLGAARALFGREPGISCIIGTGSNTALYDGEKIVAGVPPLGFIMGDEGSGAVLGKKLIGDYFKNVMPANVQSLLENRYDFTQAEILDRVYRQERPNQFLASFAPFIAEYIERSYCHELVMTSMTEFFERNVLKLPDAAQFRIGFVGSVADAFRDFIEELAQKYGFDHPKILKEPISELSAFHAINQ
ncbi:MAG TPA: hypothetical protein VKA27_08750 [Sunxiuqinia sp.]|nr:hypothetical protein [Sunxiuqinia sp.]